MNLLFYVLAAVCFLLGALRPLLDYNLGEFDMLAWGLFFFTLGHVVGGAGVDLTPRRMRRVP